MRLCHRLTVSRLISVAALLTWPLSAEAHFFMTPDGGLPTPWWSQDSLGNPQKAAPCGETTMGAATGAITTYHPGDTITLSLDETFFHPGHYRVALGVHGAQDLPVDPPVTAGTTACGATLIQSPPTFPVLADGALAHTRAFVGTQTIRVTLPPNVTCTGCMLQVTQFMSEHGLNVPGGCFYHHCATINVVAADAGIDAGQATGGGGGTMGTGGQTGTSDAGQLGAGGGGGSTTSAGGCSTAMPLNELGGIAVCCLLWRRRR